MTELRGLGYEVETDPPDRDPPERLQLTPPAHADAAMERQRALEQARDLYAALSETNQFLVTSPPPQELYDAVARIVVDYGGFQLAWIGEVDSENWVQPWASHGEARDYVWDVRVSADAERAEGQGPTGTCIREGEPVISRRLLQEAQTGPWHDVASRYDLHSSGAFPIRRAGEVVGALNVYSAEPDFLSSDLIHLLDELVLDISFALDNYDRDQHLRQLAELVEGVPDLVGLADANARILFHNPAAEQFFGTETRAASIDQFHPEWAARHVRQEGLPQAAAHGVWQGETAFLDETGQEIPFSQTIIAHWDAQGRVVRYSTVARDIRELRRAEEQIQHLSNQDAVTGAANRKQLLERLCTEVNRLNHSGHYGALLALDLDSFQVVNHSQGHAVGDALLASVAQRLRPMLRQEDLLARLGADEFVILIGDLTNESRHRAEVEVEKLVQRVQECFADPFPTDDGAFHLSASFGVALFPDDEAEPDALLQQVSSALSEAKTAGRGSCRFFQAGMVNAARKRLDLEQELRGALARNELHLNFQPIWDLGSDRISGLETLVRWNHPERGPISPGEFIPVAEQTGLIQPLGDWILDEALRTVRPWLIQGLELPLGLAVNISPQQFSGADFEEGVRRKLEANDFPAERLKLEITESLLMQNLSV
ncbi:MAG TPA: diguanylate cyclase, partial [Gammaproteobacteria bacterium]|nr:diguanylate cyclase [Gammaproteobacteria bacterium]